MVKNLDVLLENSTKLIATLDNIVETMQTMDLPKLNNIQQEDNIDRLLDKASNIGNKIIDNQTVKKTSDSLNNLLSDASDYIMMLSIPVFALSLATGGVGYIFVAPVLLAGGFITKKFANRGESYAKRGGKAIKDKTKTTKNKIKEHLKNKKEKKSLDNADINEIVEGKGEITTYQLVSFTINRITNNISEINDKIAFITNKLKNEEFSCPKEEIMTLLQNDVLNTIVKLKIDMYNLSNVKQQTSFYPDKINAILVQCKYAIDSMSEGMQITNEMMQDKIEEIKSKNNKFYDVQ
ncbi:MAG: hypothetical protein ACI4TX_05045 [Christensenellales bacterium]